MPRRRVVFAAWALAVVALVAADVAEAQRATASVTMTTDPADLAVGQPFVLRIEVVAEGGTIEDVSLPDLAGFDILGRKTSQPMEFGFGSNGRPSMRASLIHELTLMPRRGGVFALRAVRARVGGRSFESESLVLKVAGADAPAPSDMADAGTGTASGAGLHVDANFDPRVFVAASLDRTSVYVGQPVLVTYYLYQRVDGQPTQSRGSAADGFWIHDLMPRDAESRISVETVRGLQFRVQVIGRFAAFPLRSGRLALDPPEITVHPMFGAYGFGDELTRAGPREFVEVKPLPPPVPPRVAVGRFQLTAAVDPDRLRTGEATTLTVTIRGDGNLRDVALEAPVIPGVRVDPPNVEDHVSVARDVVGGERIFRYLLVPSTPGELVIPPLSLATFDPIDEAYRTLATAAIPLHVTGNAIRDDAESSSDPAEASETEGRRSTIEFGPIRRDSVFERRSTPLSSTRLFGFALSVPVFLFGAAYVVRSLRRVRSAPRDPRRARARSSKKLLDDARRQAAKGDARAFYAGVAQALHGAVEARLGQSIGSLTHSELRLLLARRGMPEDLVTRLVDELEGSDFARFSSVAGSREEMDRCLERVTALSERIARFTPTLEVAT